MIIIYYIVAQLFSIIIQAIRVCRRSRKSALGHITRAKKPRVSTWKSQFSVASKCIFNVRALRITKIRRATYRLRMPLTLMVFSFVVMVSISLWLDVQHMCSMISFRWKSRQFKGRLGPLRYTLVLHSTYATYL